MPNACPCIRNIKRPLQYQSYECDKPPVSHMHMHIRKTPTLPGQRRVWEDKARGDKVHTGRCDQPRRDLSQRTGFPRATITCWHPRYRCGPNGGVLNASRAQKPVEPHWASGHPVSKTASVHLAKGSGSSLSAMTELRLQPARTRWAQTAYIRSNDPVHNQGCSIHWCTACLQIGR